MDSDGDVLVSFGRPFFLFAPASCIPAPDLKPDSLRIESGGQLPQIAVQASLSDGKSISSSESSSEWSKSEFYEKGFAFFIRVVQWTVAKRALINTEVTFCFTQGRCCVDLKFCLDG